MEGRLAGATNIPNNRLGFRGQQTDQMGHRGLDDPGFFPGDLAQARSEDFDVVAADVGRDSQDRVQNIGGVEPTAQAGFDDGDVDMVSGEMVKRERGD